MFKLIEDFNEGFQIMEAAFPVSELRPYKVFERLYYEQRISAYGYYDQNKLYGSMIIWETNDLIFIENFAVSKDDRGMGIGSKMLSALCEMFHDKSIILEVEEPFDEMSTRRVGFYERNGFVYSPYTYEQPQISDEINEHPLAFMTYGKKLNKEMFEVMKQKVLDLAYKEEYLHYA